MGTLGGWHVVHIVLSILTAGAWLVVYVIHAITRPAVTVEVPQGHRIEYYRGYPNVLGPSEYLDVPWWKTHGGCLAGVLVPLAIAGTLLAWGALA